MVTSYESRLTQKGQIYLPRELRDRLGLGPRDRVRLEIDDDGVHIRPVGSVIRWAGAFGSPDAPSHWDDLKEAFEQGVADEAMESLRRGE